MSIDIVFPEGDAPKTCFGTEVFTSSGEKIHGVTRLEILADANHPVLIARLDVEVNKCNAKALVALLGYETLEQLANASGYELVLKQSLDLATGTFNKGTSA